MMLIKFLLVGTLNTLVGLGAIYFAMYFLSLDNITANAFGYIIGILLGFALNKRWTFANRDGITATLIRYFIVIAVAYAVNLTVVLSTHLYLELNQYLAQATGIIPYTIIAFFGSRYYAFKNNGYSNTADINQPTSFNDTETMGVAKLVDLSLVIPCFNEEDVLPETSRRLTEIFQRLIDKGAILPDSRVYFVDDGSRDGTWKKIESLAQESPFIKGIKLSRNRGHQNALLAGLLTAKGEALISIDADLQDDLGAIEPMLNAYAGGHEIVYGVRKTRFVDTFFKRVTAQTYYKLLRWMGVDVVFDHADYRLLSRRAIEALQEFSEVNLFLRGIIPQLGFSSSIVYYERAERFAGESKYPLMKMLSFAWQGVTSFSAVPLRLITGLGMTISLGSFMVTLWGLWIRLFTTEALPGWASTVLPIYFLGGIQLLCLGVIGEYLAKIYLETKRRPRFIIDKII